MIPVEGLLPAADSLLSIASNLTTIVAARSGKKAKAPDAKRVEERLSQHLLDLVQWASEVRVDPRDRPRTLADLFINLDLNVSGSASRHRQVPVSQLATYSESVAILGQPGGGKTTSLMYLASELLEARTQSADAAVPILVRFRDLGSERGLILHLVEILGGVLDDIPHYQREDVGLEFLRATFQKIPVTLLLDGLDEARQQAREGIYRDLTQILRSPRVRVLLTCRTAEYRVTLPKVRIFEIQPLTPDQVLALAQRWIHDDVDRARFLDQLRANPYAGTETRPLTLVVLAMIFIRKRDIPRHPRTVYERILRLFLEDWDESRGIVRESKYSDFSIDRKEAFLEALAFELTRAEVRGVFSHDQLIHAYGKIHRRFSLPSHQAGAGAREIESHSGLILERGPEEFEFFHLTVQEYLTARYLGRRGDLATTGLDLRTHPNELAVATAWSSDPGVFMLSVVRGIMRLGEKQLQLWDRPFVSPYFGRLVFEAPNWQRGSVLGLAVILLGHYYCVTEGEDANVGTSRVLSSFAANTEVAASIKLLRGKYLFRSPADANRPESATCRTFRVMTGKVRDSDDEAFKLALDEHPLPQDIFVPAAFLKSHGQ